MANIIELKDKKTGIKQYPITKAQAVYHYESDGDTVTAVTVSQRLATDKNDIESLKRQFDSFTHLDEGSITTTGDAELDNARTTWYGTEEERVGEAIRNQAKNLILVQSGKPTGEALKGNKVWFKPVQDDIEIANIEDVNALNAQINGSGGLREQISSISSNMITQSDLDQKQDRLIFDITPTEGSSHPVTSDGIKRAIQTIKDNSNKWTRLDGVIIKDGTILNPAIYESGDGAWYNNEGAPYYVNYAEYSWFEIPVESEETYTFSGNYRWVYSTSEKGTIIASNNNGGSTFNVGANATAMRVTYNKNTYLDGFFVAKGNVLNPTEYILPESVKPQMNFFDLSGKVTPDMMENIPKLDNLATEVEGIESVTVNKEEKTLTENILSQLTWTNGYYVSPNSGEIFPMNTQKYSNKITVKPGNILTMLPSDGVFRFICAYSGEDVVAESGATNVSSYTIPEGIDGIIISVYNSGTYLPTAIYNSQIKVTYQNIYEDQINQINEDIDAINNVIVTNNYIEQKTISVTPDYTQGAIDPAGTIFTYQDFEYTQKIPVLEGDIVTAEKENGQSARLRFVCAYSDDTAIQTSGSDIEGTNYVVPSGINGIIITIRGSENASVIKVLRGTQKTAVYIKQIPMGYMATKGSLNAGGSLVLPYHNVKNKNCYIFNANITNFNSITFQKGEGSSITVDGTNIVITNNQTSTTIPHELTINNNITLMIQNDMSNMLSLIRVASNGIWYDYTETVQFMMDDGIPTILSADSILTECTFAWTSKNVNAPIWIFGDGYLSWQETGWIHYLAADGYVNDVMLNAAAGETSEMAYNALVNLLKITTPKQVVWCLGMNDADATNTVNTNWKKYYDDIATLQKQYGFELIFYTVPTTPTINNNYKNAIIREGSYRYIDADKAVKIDNRGNWIEGALDSDNIHPTVVGAKIIYCRILADLPEIMCNY